MGKKHDKINNLEKEIDQLPNPWTFLAQKKPFGFVQTFRPSSLILGNTFKTTSICHGKQAETFGHTLWLFRPTKFFPNQRNSSVKWSIVYYMSATELTNVLPHNSLVQNKEYKLLNNHCIWRYAYSVFIHWLLPNFHSCIYCIYSVSIEGRYVGKFFIWAGGRTRREWPKWLK